MTEIATRLFGPWVRLVNAQSLRADAIAGVLGALLVLPQGFAFATLAGLPPEYGLATAIVPCAIAALFGSSWHGLPRVATVQNPYALVNRVVDNGLDEAMYRSEVSLLAYSPLGFGSLSGKYDTSGFSVEHDVGRMARFEAFRKQRWGRPEVLAAARKYNALARANGLTPTQMALAFCYTSWRVASTIIGVTTLAQLDEDLDAWGTNLSPELLAQIDEIRWTDRDPAQ